MYWTALKALSKACFLEVELYSKASESKEEIDKLEELVYK